MLKAGLSRYNFWFLLILGLVLEVLFFQFAGLRDAAAQESDLFYYFGAAYVVYILIIIYVSFFWDKSFFSPELIVAFAVGFRLTLLFSPPLLSDDVYRYVWDGKVANMGISPYRYAPDSDNLTGLRDDVIYPKINHKSVPAIYPPLMQHLFRGVTLLSPSVTAVKFAVLFFDIGTLFVLFLILKFLERSLAWALVYAWNPLVVIEFAGSGHGDSAGIFFLMLGIYLAMRARSIWSGVFLSLSFLAKFIAVIFLPLVEDVRSRWKEILIALALFAAVVFVLYYPFLDEGVQVFAGLRSYAATWEFNSSLYAPVYDYLQKYFMNDPAPNTFLGWATENKARSAAKFAVFCAGFCFFTGVWIHHVRKSYEGQKENILHAAYLILGAFTLLNPAAHPWTVIWIVPFLCFFPNPAWMLLTGTIFLSYRVLSGSATGGAWNESSEIRMWEYVPFYSILIGHFLWITITKRLKAHPPELSK